MQEPVSAPEPRLFVRATRGTQRPLEILRLDSWGDALLGTKLRGELATGYLILLVVCVFEVMAWTLLFNFMLHAGQMTISLATVIAAALGLLWGMGIFAIDKNLITSDLLAPGWRKYVGLFARISLVLGAAFLTAQPIEQLVFRTLVEEHLKQEVLREEAVRYAQKLQELNVERAKLESNRPEQNMPAWSEDAVKDRRAKHDNLEVRISDAATRVTQAELRSARAMEELTRARRRAAYEQKQDPDSADTRKARYQAQKATAERDEAAAEHELALAQQKALNADLDNSEKSLDKAEHDRQVQYDRSREALDKGQDALKEKHQSYQRFLEDLSGIAYGEPLRRENGEPFRWKAAGAIERMEALNLIRDNTAPRWPVADAETLRQAAELAGLSDEFSRGSQGRTDVFYLWLVVFLVAAAIPALCIFYKFTMSQELKLYYSVEAQAHAGNPQAIALMHARNERYST